MCVCIYILHFVCSVIKVLFWWLQYAHMVLVLTVVAVRKQSVLAIKMMDVMFITSAL